MSHRTAWDESNTLDRGIFLRLLQELNDPDLVRHFLAKVTVEDSGIQLDSSFGKFARQHGWSSFEFALTSVIRATTAETLNRNAELLASLCLLRDKNAERITLCTQLVNGMVKAMLAIDAEKPLSRLIDHALTQDEKYDLTGAHLNAIFNLESRIAKLPTANTAISHWLVTCRQALEKRTAQAPQQPTDYRRAAKLSCDCSDCSALSRFLADPLQSQARFPLAKARRRHLHQIIDTNRCDLTHVQMT